MKVQSRRGWPTVLLALLMFSVNGAAAAGGEDDEPVRFHLQDRPFSILPPQGWGVIQWGAYRFAFTGPEINGFTPNFTVAASPYDGNPPVLEIIEDIRATFDQDVEIQAHGLREVDNHSAGVIRIVFDLDGERSVNEQIFVAGKQTLYSLSFMAPEEIYPTLEPVFEAVVRSVRIDW